MMGKALKEILNRMGVTTDFPAPVTADPAAAAILHSSARAVREILAKRAEMDRNGQKDTPLFVAMGEHHFRPAHKLHHLAVAKGLHDTGEKIGFAFEQEHDLLAKLFCRKAGLEEPREDWTEAAQKNFAAAMSAERPLLGDRVVTLDAAQADEFAPITNLHRAVADAITMHHARNGLKLATKGDRLEWSLGDAVRPLKERTGADYALFTWIRDSYASGERKAAMLAMALLGAISIGGEQQGYASLVDLNTGRVVWFNQLDRMSGDLRDPEPARETVETLLKGFPARQ